jgi:PadR family transcriptional regulator, regulatory protein PadR
MARDDLLGSFEQLVLLAVARLGENAYGMTVRQEIEARTGRDVTLGAVYATLDRLETKGYVTSHSGAASSARGGRAKRFFRLEGAGAQALSRSLQAVDEMRRGLKALGRPQLAEG